MTVAPARARRLPVLIATVVTIGGLSACAVPTAPSNSPDCRPPSDSTGTSSGQGPLCDATQPWY